MRASHDGTRTPLKPSEPAHLVIADQELNGAASPANCAK